MLKQKTSWKFQRQRSDYQPHIQSATMTSADSSVELPLSLEDLCFVYLICNIELFPPESLSLLPTQLRRRLLLNLPIVDISRLEKSTVVSGIDLNFDVWRPLCCARLPHDVVALQLKDYCPSTPIQWREEFFCSLVCMILNHFHPAFPFRHFAPHLLKFSQDVLFAVPNILGIENWQQLAFQHPFLASVKDTTLLEWPPGFVYPQHIQEFFRPWLVPPQHGWIVDPQQQYYSSSQLLHMIMKECSYEPKRLMVICDQFCNSEFMVTHCFRNLLQKFLSSVESLVLMASLHNADSITYVEPTYTSVFNDDKNTCGIIPRFMVEAFLSQEEPQLHSLKMEGSIEFVTHTLWCLSPLLTEVKSTDIHCSSLQRIYKDTMNNVPYSGLQSIAIEIYSIESNSAYIMDYASTYLGTIIAHQTSLTSVCLNGCPMPSLGSLNPFATLLVKPKFHLVLEYMDLSISIVKASICSLLDNHSEWPSSLALLNVTIVGDNQDQLPSLSPVNIIPRAKDGGEGNLILSGLEFSDDATAADLFNWLRGQERLNLKAIALVSIGMLESENICDCFASNLNARIKHCRIDDVPLQLTSASTFEAFFQNFGLESLEFCSCNINLPSLTQGLRKQSVVQTLTLLALSDNALGQCLDDDLRAFFDVVFSLPETAKLELCLENNDLDAHHLELLCNSWREANAKRHSVLEGLSITDSNLPEPSMIPGLRDVAKHLNYDS